MINSKFSEIEKNRGITLIALVVTIIVLLILAGIICIAAQNKNLNMRITNLLLRTILTVAMLRLCVKRQTRHLNKRGVHYESYKY